MSLTRNDLRRSSLSVTGAKPAAVPSPLDAALWLRARLHTRMKRNAIKDLLKAEQHRLDDLGITRADIHEALAGSGDAALALRCISADRRHRELAATKG